MILHVVDPGMGEDDGRLDLPDDGGNPGDRRSVVKDGQIVEERRMRRRPRHLRRREGLIPADPGDLGPVVLHGTQAAVGQVPDVNFGSRGLEQEERARHRKLDVVGMRHSRKSDVRLRAHGLSAMIASMAMEVLPMSISGQCL